MDVDMTTGPPPLPPPPATSPDAGQSDVTMAPPPIRHAEAGELPGVTDDGVCLSINIMAMWRGPGLGRAVPGVWGPAPVTEPVLVRPGLGPGTWASQAWGPGPEPGTGAWGLRPAARNLGPAPFLSPLSTNTPSFPPRSHVPEDIGSIMMEACLCIKRLGAHMASYIHALRS